MSEKPFKQKIVLVTGGAGFIGSHLCDHLIKENRVICIDNFSTGKEKNIDFLLRHQNFEFIKHDINEPIDLEKVPELKKFKFRWQGLQEIYHLACPASPSMFNKLGVDVLVTSSVGTKIALDLALKYKAKFLFLSSSVIYGKAMPGEELKENYVGQSDPLGYRNCYIEGKRFSESLVHNYRNQFGLDAKIIRAFTTYGPRMKLSDGRTISSFVRQAMENKDIIIDGDQNIRNSYCYIDDLVNGIIKMMKSKETGPINLGNPEDLPIIEVVKKVISSTESKSQIVFKQREKGAHVSHIPNIGYAKDHLGWEPIVLLETGLSRTINYLKTSKSLLGFNSFGQKKD